MTTGACGHLASDPKVTVNIFVGKSIKRDTKKHKDKPRNHNMTTKRCKTTTKSS